MDEKHHYGEQFEIGVRVIHKVYGGGCVARIANSGRITVEFDSGTTSHGINPQAEGLVVESVEHRYQLKHSTTPQIQDQLKSIDQGDTSSAKGLIESLEKSKEFQAVNAACRRLEKYKFPLDVFLLVKDAKAYRKTGNADEAIGRAQEAHGLARNPRERSMAKTILGASLCDIELNAEAAQECLVSLDHAPNSFHAHRTMGRILIK